MAKRSAVLDRAPEHSVKFSGELVEARHLDEITVATFALAAVRDAPATPSIYSGRVATVRLDPGLVHVMPVRSQ